MDESVFAFGEFELDLARFELRGPDGPVHLEPRALDVLTHLVVNRHRVVGKNELLDAVWGSQFVTESALTTSLKSVRRAIGDSGTQQRWIRTIHRRGYQFSGAVHRLGVRGGLDERDEPGGPTGPSGLGGLSGSQEIRFCNAHDGTRIAYATVGSGPVLMKAANWMSHLDREWTSPVWGHWLHGLAAGRTLVRYDERGCGLSQWDVPSFDFDDWVDDLATVVDAVGLERFPLLGVSQGGPVAIAYAVQHPERVSRLVLAGAYARGRRVRASSDAERRSAELDLEVARVGWEQQDGSFMQVFASQFLPSGTREQWQDFIDFLRISTPPANAVRFLEVFGRIDVSAIAGQVQCPTLILQSRNDVRVPRSQAMELASLIPDSRLVLLDSSNHLLTDHEPAWRDFLSQLESFLS